MEVSSIVISSCRQFRSTMLPPSVQVNTFVQENDKTYIDPISTIFIISEAVFGFFRLPLIWNKKWLYYLPLVFYTVSVNVALLYLTYTWLLTHNAHIMMMVQIIQQFFCALFGSIFIKRLHLYYTTLNRFDIDVGCRPKVSRHSLQNLVQMILTVITLCILLMLPGQLLMVKHRPPLFLLVLHIASTIEVDFYGHLLNLLVLRMKLINHYIESSLSNVKSESNSLMNEFKSLTRSDANAEIGHCQMRKLMDLYHIMVEAYDFLIDAIKWQLLVTIISTFLLILGQLYVFSLDLIKTGQSIQEGILLQLVLSVLVMIPLFAPCTFGDKVHHEVKRLRELLACRLYENKLDKSGRSIARALLAFTETRDLSFRLLRMLNIDISLPFKFVGLLVTYLIILLQFEKVINPDTETDALNKTA